MSLGPLEIGLIVLAILLLFGYKKLPDASRSLGRSLRIFKGEMKGMKDDDSAGGGLRTKDAAQATPVVRGEVVSPTASTASDDLTARMAAQAREVAAREAEARAAEARAAELRARADQARTADGTR